jgi:predicted NUDIX family NTP pyrophosphohydrolase
LLIYRHGEAGVEVFLVHPGGPFWARKDLGAWSIPKGEFTDGEQPFHAAIRELREETGFSVEGEFAELGTVKQSSGKIVSAWAVRGDFDPASLVSNLCEIEWPPRSKRLISIPEVDRGAWFSVSEAHARIFEAQKPFLDRLSRILDEN